MAWSGPLDKDRVFSNFIYYLRQIWLGITKQPDDVPAEVTSPSAKTIPTDDLFEACLKVVLKWEGGWTDDPYDPGGATNKGITIHDWAVWNKVKVSPANANALKATLKAAPDDTIKAIYRAYYWEKASCGHLPTALALVTFDCAVNQGVVTSLRMLQSAVGTDVDGEFGPKTKAAAAKMDQALAIRTFIEARRVRYRSLKTFWRFGRGWLNRVNDVEEVALGWLKEPPGSIILKNAGAIPEWVTRARSYFGEKEIRGTKNNTRIVQLWETAKVPMKVKDDETPWCMAFWCAINEECGIAAVRSGWARDGLKWGTKIKEPCYGATVIFERGTGGHIGFVVGRQGNDIVVLGGNQSDQVKLSVFPTSRVLGYRWPNGYALPDKTGLTSLPSVGAEASKSEK